jgi:hypothetical protein
MTACIDFAADLESVCNWILEWQLQISFDKCELMHIGTGNPGTIYSINGDPLVPTSQVRDLGILFSSNLKFEKHISQIVRSAFYRCNLIFRCFLSRDVSFMCNLFKTYVRPLLEYNCVLWNPHFVKDINALERVQKYFTRRLPSLSHLSYKDRLATCNLDSLELRRMKADLIFVYKITHGLVDLRIEDFFVLDPDNRTRGHGLKFKVVTVPKCDAYKFSFAHRVIAPWNSLSNDCVQSNNISRFRLNLDSRNFDKYLKGTFSVP